jgi:hypothetical protein
MIVDEHGTSFDDVSRLTVIETDALYVLPETHLAEREHSLRRISHLEQLSSHLVNTDVCSLG